MDLFYLFTFAMLLIPKDYIYLKKIMSDTATNDISIAVPINILLISAMSIVIIYEFLREGSGNIVKTSSL